MQASNYELPDTNGILMNFDLHDEVGLLDFDKAKYLFELGYNTTLQLIDSIKSKVPRSIPLDTINKRRAIYKQSLPEVVFKNITISGSTEKQRRYIINEIRPAGHRYVQFKDFKKAYFRLMSENAIEYGLINSIFSLKASEMKNENASVRLHADSDIGNGLLKIIPDNYSLYDVRVIDEELSGVREEIRDEVAANLVNEQYEDTYPDAG